MLKNRPTRHGENAARGGGRLPLGFAGSGGFLKAGLPESPFPLPLFVAASRPAHSLRHDVGTPEDRLRFTETGRPAG